MGTAAFSAAARFARKPRRKAKAPGMSGQWCVSFLLSLAAFAVILSDKCIDDSAERFMRNRGTGIATWSTPNLMRGLARA
jgi:hypothetical protein